MLMVPFCDEYSSKMVLISSGGSATLSLNIMLKQKQIWKCCLDDLLLPEACLKPELVLVVIIIQCLLRGRQREKREMCFDQEYGL